MVIISEKDDPHASWEFEAEILVLHHPTTISVNYQAMGKQKLNDLKN
jgi:GTPase